MRASPWISTHLSGCGVSTLCVCVGVMCMYVCITLDLYTPFGMWCEDTVCVCVDAMWMYACITLDLYTPFGMWCEYTVCVCRCHVHVCVHHPGSLHTVWDMV